MSIEKRKARSLKMKLAVRGVQKIFSRIPSGEKLTDSELSELREKISGGGIPKKQRRGVLTKKKGFGGVLVEVTAALGERTGDTILYLHGGAFVFGIAPYQRRYAETLAMRTGCSVVMVDYSLSPENKFPKALDECESVFGSIRNLAPDGKIILAGDSAGAGLCLSLVLRLKAKGKELPASVILHSPYIDLSGALDRTINDDINNDFIIKKGLKNTVNEIYLGTADPTDYEISPYYGDFSGFPPTFITCEEHESLYADSIELDSLLEKAGTEVKTIVFDGAFHTFGTLGDTTPETKRLTNEIKSFIYKAPEA